MATNSRYERELLTLLPKHKAWARRKSRSMSTSVSSLARFIYDAVGEMGNDEFSRFIGKIQK